MKGDAIELDPANAQKIAAVVAGLRRQAAVKPPTYDHLQNRVANIEKRFFAILDEIDSCRSLSSQCRQDHSPRSWLRTGSGPKAHGFAPDFFSNSMVSSLLAWVSAVSPWMSGAFTPAPCVHVRAAREKQAI